MTKDKENWDFVLPNKNIVSGIIKVYCDTADSIDELKKEADEQNLTLKDYVDSNADASFRMGLYLGGMETIRSVMKFMLGVERFNEVMGDDGNI